MPGTEKVLVGTRLECFCAYDRVEYGTYGCDDGPGEEEGTAKVPVAGIVGRVSDGTHSCTHSVDRMLGKERKKCFIKCLMTFLKCS